MGDRVIYFFSIFIVFISLIFLSQKRNTKNKNLKVKVNFRYDNGKFLDSQMVNKLLIQREDTTFFLKEDMLDLKEVEDLLISNPMIATADIFRTPQGILSVKLEERKPIVRVINNQEEFYLDNIGHRVPLSKKYSARVPIFYGKVDKNLMDLVNFIKLIKKDSFAKSEVIDLKSLNNNYVLGLRTFPFKIIWGKNSKYKNKIKKLKYLYYYLEKKDFLKIEKVNLSFDKQIVLDYE
jgi:cell division protein FtsQ